MILKSTLLSFLFSASCYYWRSRDWVEQRQSTAWEEQFKAMINEHINMNMVTCSHELFRAAKTHDTVVKTALP